MPRNQTLLRVTAACLMVVKPFSMDVFNQLGTASGLTATRFGGDSPCTLASDAVRRRQRGSGEEACILVRVEDGDCDIGGGVRGAIAAGSEGG